MNNPLLLQTAQQYILLFRQLAAITDTAMDHIENNPPTYLSSLDRVAQSVETIANLRGDSGAFEDSRPAGLVEFQHEMNDTENKLRNRLLSLGYTYPTPRSLSETV